MGKPAFIPHYGMYHATDASTACYRTRMLQHIIFGDKL